MAITKERLEELIKENAMIYMLSKSRNVDRLQLHKNILSDKNDNFSDDIAIFYLGLGVLRISLEDLYEHEHDAIHASKYVNMERVEKLSLPFWSEVESFKNSDAYNREYVLFAKLDEYGTAVRYVLVLTRRNAFSELIDTIDVRWEINDSEQPEYDVIFQKPLIKENYAEACEIVKKIWENK